MSKYFKQITFLFVLLTIAVNAAAEALPFNNISTAAISDKYLTLFTPAGYVFAIWGVIYIGWLAYAIYPFLNSKQDYKWMLPAFPYFIISSLANMAWLVLWHYEQLGVSVVVMLILLVSLIQMYRKLEIGIYPASLKTKLMVHVPISVYLGWISVATIANIAAFLVQIEWTGLGIPAATWTVIMLAIATLLGVVMVVLRKDIAFVGVLFWAFIGINVARNGSEPAISSAIFVCLLLLGAISVYWLFLRNQRGMPG